MTTDFPPRRLQLRHATTDAIARVFIQSRINMRRASHHRDAIRNRNPRHRQRSFHIRRPIINTRQNMAMQINHKIGITQ
jgi:hypothetical protein